MTVPCSPKLRSKTRGAQHQRALEDKIEKVSFLSFLSFFLSHRPFRSDSFFLSSFLTPLKQEQHNHNQQLQDRQQQRKRKLENISRPENSAILTPRNPNLHQQHSKPKQKQYQQQGLTTPSPFSFQTDRRASIREDTEPQRKQRKLQQQGEEERHQTEKEKAERREIRRMRREMVHKVCVGGFCVDCKFCLFSLPNIIHLFNRPVQLLMTKKHTQSFEKQQETSLLLCPNRPNLRQTHE